MFHRFPVRAGIGFCAQNSPRSLFDVRVRDGSQLVQDVLDHERVHEADLARIFSRWLDPWHEALLAMRRDGFAVNAASTPPPRPRPSGPRSAGGPAG
jgi:hypothetical protein